MKNTETYNDHEVRIRLLEKIAEKIDTRFDKMESKIDSHFMWTMGLIFAGLIIPVLLHSSKLI